jgi:arginyl-tRNA synthetase
MQCNGAMALGKRLNRQPREIAMEVAACLRNSGSFDTVEVAGPGFINLRLSLRRILSAEGHITMSDIHLGDWGLQMGMLIAQIRYAYPDLSCFQAQCAAQAEGLPADALGFGMQELQLLYPQAAACKADPERMAEAREVTAALQAGHPGYTALWRAIRSISLEAQQRDFDMLLGESDVQPLIAGMISELRARHRCRERRCAGDRGGRGKRCATHASADFGQIRRCGTVRHHRPGHHLAPGPRRQACEDRLRGRPAPGIAF